MREIIPPVIPSIIISPFIGSQFKKKLIWPLAATEEKNCRKWWFPHLSVSLDLGVNKSPEDVGCDGKVDEDELRLLVEAEQGEVVTQLHRLNGVFLLLNRKITKRL